MTQETSFLLPMLGGILIGLASLVATIITGTIPGISGVLSRALTGARAVWPVVFLVGLIAGGGLMVALSERAAVYRPVPSLVLMAVAGILVGLGTRVSGGCTSGHGVCGIGLGSKTAIVATLCFMGAAMVTVYLTHQVMGGGAS